MLSFYQLMIPLQIVYKNDILNYVSVVYFLNSIFIQLPMVFLLKNLFQIICLKNLFQIICLF